MPSAGVAELFGVTLRTLRNWRRAGILTPVRIRGRNYYAITDIEALSQWGGGHDSHGVRDISVLPNSSDIG